MKEVVVSAPGKLMLLGEHAVVYGKPCLVTAVNKRLNIKVSLTGGRDFILNAPDVSVRSYKKPLAMLGRAETPKGAAFVEKAVLNFKERYSFEEGLLLETDSEFSSGFGFGSSSASTVCVIKALSEIFERKLSKKDIFDLSYKTVLDVQKTGSGFDVASAVYGGTIYFVAGGEEIERIDNKSFNLIVGYSGTKADTSEIVREVAKKREEEKEKVDGIFAAIEILVENGKKFMLESDWENFGKTMNENQVLLSQLGVSIGKLDHMIDAARNAGAYGAKLSGAGGGDCMLALSPPDKLGDIRKAIESTGGKIIDIEASAEGVNML